MKRKTQREQVIELLKTGWYSAYAMNMAIKSTGGGPRVIELKTTKKLDGWMIIERRSSTEKCQEFMLVPDESTKRDYAIDAMAYVIKAFDKTDEQKPNDKTNMLVDLGTGQTQLFKVESNYF